MEAIGTHLNSAASSLSAGEMELATSVVLLPLLNPVQLAEDAATINAITGGRFILGVGLCAYGLVPAPLLIPMIVLATAATIIASQAMISGVFSMARQAIRLNYLPRLSVIHTSSATEGQIYIPFLNWAMMIGCLTTVFLFRSSTALAEAYGIAVTAVMGITSLLFAEVALKTWRWRPIAVASSSVTFWFLRQNVFVSG